MKTIISAKFKYETNRYAAGVSGVKEYTEWEYLFGGNAICEQFQRIKNEFGGFFWIWIKKWNVGLSRFLF